MLEFQLRQQLLNVARRMGRLWMWRRLTWVWIVSSVLVVCWALAGRPIVPAAGWFCAVGLFAGIVWIRSRLLATPKTVVARRIEQAFPDLNSRLLAAIEQCPDIETGRLNVLQRQVIAEAIHHARMNDWSDAVSPRLMTRVFVGQTVALVSFVLIGLFAMQVTSRSAAAISKSASSPATSYDELPVIVEPGNTELERGTSLLVLARFTGKVPATVNLVWKGADGLENQLPLSKSLDDPIFATRLAVVKEDIAYRIEFDGRRSPDYQVTVYDLPTLIRSDLKLEFPSYTNLEPKLLEDAFEATVVEGTQVTITCNVNKPMASAKFFNGDQAAFDLQIDPANPKAYQVQFTPTKRLRLKLALIDDAGRKNRDPEEFRIDVVPNRAPDLKLVFPGKDVKASPLEEIQVDATAIDDFAVLEAGLVVQVIGRDAIKLPLGQNLNGGEQHQLHSLQQLENFRVQPDELVTYYLYAIDYGPDGKPRQTSSDVFFAEIRSFDEIYRQVDQQGEGEMQSSQKPPDSLSKLLELQKQVIIATWKLAKSSNPNWAGNTTEQIQTINESQLQAIQKLQSLRERMTQPQLQPIFSTIAESMDKARQELGRSLDQKSFQPLNPASAAEQSAYQGLLKLRAKEHLLMQSKAKGNGQENEEKEKLDLELKRKENRYESEKAGAKKEDSNINREALAILDRLKELANRQDGINEQVKELEAQMRLAKTEAEREEIERRLKRLREEQQQLLHDSDELRNKLNKSTQPEAVATTKQQLEQTRQRMVETAEKLREGQLSQALASGTRAERELKQLHEDFRKQTAAQFADAMRSLRDEARQLAEREKQLGEQLSGLGDDSRTLRQTKERSQLEAEFQQQRQQANEVVEKAKQIVEQSESSEPLLSKQLYDTLRSTRESKLDSALNATLQLLKRGVLDQATRVEKQAKTGIDQLKQGIEKAAESILGNEVDSLKRARKELAELSQQLEKEIQAKGQDGKTGKGLKPNPGAEAQGQAGQGKEDSQGKDGKAQPGQREGEGEEQGNGKPSDKAGNGTGSKSASKPSESNGQQSADGKESGEGQSPGQGDGKGKGEGQGQGEGSPNSKGEGGAGGGSSDASSPTSSNKETNDQPTGQKRPVGLRSAKKPGSSPSRSPGRKENGSDDSNNGGGAGNSQGGGPLTGGDYAEFNERLRDVESMISDPQLQAEVQKVRDRARSARAEFKRHTQTPNWDLVRTSVHQPMIELQQRLADEIAKRESPESLVPVDRDPVPTKYRELVRTYYERLGSGKEE